MPALIYYLCFNLEYRYHISPSALFFNRDYFIDLFDFDFQFVTNAIRNRNVSKQKSIGKTLKIPDNNSQFVEMSHLILKAVPLRMEQQFSWDNHFHTSSASLGNSMIFSNENQSNNIDPTSFAWSQDEQTPWSIPETCPPKRLKLEERLQGIHEKTNDTNFQSFYLTSCFHNPGDLLKDPSGFSYQPQPYLRKCLPY